MNNPSRASAAACVAWRSSSSNLFTSRALDVCCSAAAAAAEVAHQLDRGAHGAERRNLEDLHIGQIIHLDPVEREVTVRFDHREVIYDFGELDELSLAYAITIHKSQGSEFPAVVIPLATQHFLLLQRNLVYTGVTRGKKLVVLVGQRKALAMAVKNNKTEQRFSGLLSRLTAKATPQ